MPTLDAPELLQLVHDLRQPLGTLSVRLGLLEHESMSEECRKHATALRGDLQRIASIIEKIAASATDESDGVLAPRAGELVSHLNRPR